MPRRTVNIPAGLDRAVRSLQARMIVELDKDVAYTDALTAILFLGFMRPGPKGEVHAFWKPGAPRLEPEEFNELLEEYSPTKREFIELLDLLPQHSTDEK